MGKILVVLMTCVVGVLSHQDSNWRSQLPAVVYDENKGYSIDPNSHIVYNFEHKRSDQEPQIEQRDEHVGRYLYRGSTSTTPGPVAPEISRQDYHRTTEQAARPAPVDFRQAPTTDLLEPRFNPVDWNLRYPHIDTWQWRTTTSTTTASPITMSKSQEPSQPSFDNIQYPALPAAAPAPYPDATADFRPAAHRGQHRFNWSDLTTTTTMPTPIARAAITAPTKGGIHYPPPKPTLSPWGGDNLGK